MNIAVIYPFSTTLVSLDRILIILLLAVFTSPTYAQDSVQKASEILELIKQKYDPESNWDTTKLNIHIQEPRVQNTARFSVLRLDNNSGSFSLNREYDVGTVERIITENMRAEVLLNGSSGMSEEIKAEYGFMSERNFGYRTFYQLMYGLPMSLTEDIVEELGDIESANFAGRDVYSISIELREVIISKHWKLLIDKIDHTLIALIFERSGTQGEMIVFDGTFTWDRITTPRFRHWYETGSGEYLGSDVIVKDLDQ